MKHFVSYSRLAGEILNRPVRGYGSDTVYLTVCIILPGLFMLLLFLQGKLVVLPWDWSC